MFIQESAYQSTCLSLAFLIYLLGCPDSPIMIRATQKHSQKLGSTIVKSPKGRHPGRCFRRHVHPQNMLGRTTAFCLQAFPSTEETSRNRTAPLSHREWHLGATSMGHRILGVPGALSQGQSHTSLSHGCLGGQQPLMRDWAVSETLAEIPSLFW